jgi:hypothetical protein
MAEQKAANQAKRKKTTLGKARRPVAGSLGLGALALAMGLTMVPKSGQAAVCVLFPLGLTATQFGGPGDFACGPFAFAGSLLGPDDGNTAVGNSAFAGSILGAAFDNTALGDAAFAGSFLGDAIDNTALGTEAFAASILGNAEGNTATGDLSFAGSILGYAYGNTANGNNAFAGSILGDAAGNTALGAYSYAGSIGGNAFGNTAVGSYATARGSYATAGGANTQANGAGSVAIGTDADGNGAISNRQNEFVLGTDDHTYTAPGISSGLSRARQSGPLEVVTSDAEGHLATDGGEIFKRLDEAESGIALAMSMEDPDLIGNERFGARMNYGNFEGANALSWTFAGVLGRDVLRVGDRISVGGGFGVGFDEGHAEDVWGGRVGAQWTWGNAPAVYR